GNTEMRPLPPTAAVIDLNAPSGESAGNEPLKVFRVQEDEETVPTLPAWSDAAPRPAPSRKAPPARQQTRRPAVSPPSAAGRPARAQPPARPHSVVPPPETEEAGGGWVASGLFLLVLLAGLALAGYTLAWPFLPPF